MLETSTVITVVRVFIKVAVGMGLIYLISLKEDGFWWTLNIFNDWSMYANPFFTWSTRTVSKNPPKNPPETNRNSKHKWWTFAIRQWCSWCNFKKFHPTPTFPLAFRAPGQDRSCNHTDLQMADGYPVPFPGTLKTWRKKWSFCHNNLDHLLFWALVDSCDLRWTEILDIWFFQKSIVARQQPPGSIGSNGSLPHPSTTLWPTNEDQKYLAYKWYWYTQDAFPVANGKLLLPCFFTKW